MTVRFEEQIRSPVEFGLTRQSPKPREWVLLKSRLISLSLAALFEHNRTGTTEQIQGVLRAIRRHLAMDVGFISEFVSGRRVFRFSDGKTSSNPIKVGASDPLDKSFCYYIAQGLMPELMQDAREDPIASTMPVTEELPVGAHLSVPLRHENGDMFGTLCCFSFTPDRSLTNRDLQVLRMCADIVTAVMERDHFAALDREARRTRIKDVIDRQAINILYQPIYRTSDGRLMAFEALSRFAADPVQPPDVWFAEAAQLDLGEDLEFLAVEKALVASDALGAPIKLTVNLSPASLLSPRLNPAFADAPVERIIVELTEHAVIDCYETLRKALAPLRARGLRLAIDDVGAGHSTFRHVLDLSPEFIKLDRSLIRGIDADSSRRAFAEAITNYGRRIGCEVVAEGIETPTEYETLREIGVTRAQGYLLGRPMPVEQAQNLPDYAAIKDAGGEGRGPAA